ncbi:MAG: C39 family peptidase [Clostridiales bacterium]|nr:C39 family peptidase [Clostridiales bacterium]
MNHELFPADTPSVETPVLRTEDELKDTIRQLAEKYDGYKDIHENYDRYPEALLGALANNPEMLDFVKGYPENDGSVTGGLTKKEKEESYPLFLQWDERWGYAAYGESCIGISGCGPTCLSMVVYALTKDDSATPDRLADYAWKQDYYVEGTGTSWSLMTEGAKAFGLQGRELSLDEGVLRSELDQGHPVICAMRAGDFTTAGHFIMIYAYDKDGFSVNDPNCIERSQKKWSYEDLSRQIKNLWSYYSE